MHVERQLIAVEGQETLTKQHTKNKVFASWVSVIFFIYTFWAKVYHGQATLA